MSQLDIPIPTDIDFTTCERIGSGAFGTVYRLKLGDHDLAVKQIQRTNDSDESIQEAKKEFELLTKLDNEHIVKVFKFQVKDDCFLVFMEYIAGGTLRRFIREQPQQCLTEKETVDFTRQLLSALEYIHSLNIMHRDIKPDNILLDTEKSSLKLGDFGLGTKLLTIRTETKLTTFCGTQFYMAPEVFERKYGTKSELWSVGVTILEMLNGKPPGHDLDLYQIIKKHAKHEDMRYTFPSDISEAFKDLILHLLCRDADRRPSATQALHHNAMRIPYVADSTVNYSRFEIALSEGTTATINRAMALKLPIFKVHEEINPEYDQTAAEHIGITLQYLRQTGKAAILLGTDVETMLTILIQCSPDFTFPGYYSEYDFLTEYCPMVARWRHIYYIPAFRLIICYADQFPKYSFPIIERMKILECLETLDEQFRKYFRIKFFIRGILKKSKEDEAHTLESLEHQYEDRFDSNMPVTELGFASATHLLAFMPDVCIKETASNNYYKAMLPPEPVFHVFVEDSTGERRCSVQ